MRLLLLGTLLGAASCRTMAGTGGMDGGTSALAGEYRGYLWVDGDPVEATLVMTPRGARVNAQLDAAAVVSGSGEGRLAGDVLVVEIPYRTTCPGTLRMEGRVDGSATRYEGSFQAEDCTGQAAGRFDLRRP